MKILLVYPPQENSVSHSPQGKISEKAGIFPPVGLLNLVSPVIESGKHEIKILDTIAEQISYPEIEEYIKSEKPDVVGVSCNTVYLLDAVLVARIAKKLNPGIITVAGGPHVDLYPIETVTLKEFDYAIRGEAELVFLPFLDSIEKKGDPGDLPGVITKTNLNKKIETLCVKDIENLPIPNRRLLPYKKYNSFITKGKPITIIMASRGCPYNCAFCPSGKMKIRMRSAEKVIEEIEDCLKLGIKDILFFDELFNYNYNRATEICDRIIAKNLKLRWHVRARAESFDEKLLKKMKQAGCNLIQLGIESGTERGQKILNKNLNLKKVEEIVRMIRKAGILAYGNFMIGLPGEKREEITETVEFANKLNLDYAVFSVTQIPPGTEFYRSALKNKVISYDFWKDHALNPDKKIENIYWPVDFSQQKLYDMSVESYRKFYLRPKYFLNFVFRVASLRQIFLQFKAAITLFYEFFTRRR